MEISSDLIRRRLVKSMLHQCHAYFFGTIYQDLYAKPWKKKSEIYTCIRKKQVWDQHSPHELKFPIRRNKGYGVLCLKLGKLHTLVELAVINSNACLSRPLRLIRRTYITNIRWNKGDSFIRLRCWSLHYRKYLLSSPSSSTYCQFSDFYHEPLTTITIVNIGVLQLIYQSKKIMIDVATATVYEQNS